MVPQRKCSIDIKPSKVGNQYAAAINISPFLFGGRYKFEGWIGPILSLLSSPCVPDCPQWQAVYLVSRSGSNKSYCKIQNQQQASPLSDWENSNSLSPLLLVFYVMEHAIQFKRHHTISWRFECQSWQV